MALPDFSSVSRTTTAFGSSQIPNKSSGTSFDLLDPANARRAISGLLPGGVSSLSKMIPNFGFNGGDVASGAGAAGEDDWRVRLSLADNASIFYKDQASTYNAIMAPLIETHGVIFPYTPTINVTHNANYSQTALTHSNYAQQFYNNSDVADIIMTGDFTVQSVEEGQYLMAAVYFLRSATKMFFGQGDNVGNPPPILFLDGYGSHYFPHVPCVITSFTHNLASDVDYLQVPITQTSLEDVTLNSPDITNGAVDYLDNQGKEFIPAHLVSKPNKITKSQKYSTITSTTRVPTSSSVTVNVRPIYSRKNLHDNFNLNDFAQGKLVGKGGFGGFL